MDAFLTALATGLLSGGAVSIGIAYVLRKSIDNAFDAKLATLKSDLVREEERLKAELAVKGQEIDTLRSGALTGLMTRQGELAKRRIYAVEGIWTAVLELHRLKFLASFASQMDLKRTISLAKRSPSDIASFKKFGEQTLGNVPDASHFGQLGAAERPFVSQYTWALFSAYTTILMFSLMFFSMLKVGVFEDFVADPSKVAEVVKSVLPERAREIEENKPEFALTLIDELEAKLLNSLREALDQREAEHANVDQAADILSKVHLAIVSQQIVAPISATSAGG